MTKRTPEPTKRPRERAFLIGVQLRDQEQILSLDDSLSELGMLARTAGLNVVGQTTQQLERFRGHERLAANAAGVSTTHQSGTDER